jgi:hypothetical protein
MCDLYKYFFVTLRYKLLLCCSIARSILERRRDCRSRLVVGWKLFPARKKKRKIDAVCVRPPLPATTHTKNKPFHSKWERERVFITTNLKHPSLYGSYFFFFFFCKLKFFEGTFLMPHAKKKVNLFQLGVCLKVFFFLLCVGAGNSTAE